MPCMQERRNAQGGIKQKPIAQDECVLRSGVISFEPYPSVVTNKFVKKKFGEQESVLVASGC